jgi:hypothetical protein
MYLSEEDSSVTTNNHFALKAVLDAFSKFKYYLATHCPYVLANYTMITPH